MSEQKHTPEPRFPDRPCEPCNSSEDPEQWAVIADWEMDRADKAEVELARLQSENARLEEKLAETQTQIDTLIKYNGDTLIEIDEWGCRHDHPEIGDEIGAALAKIQSDKPDDPKFSPLAEAITIAECALDLCSDKGEAACLRAVLAKIKE